MRLTTLRVQVRKNASQIINHLVTNYIERPSGKARSIKDNPVCMFCNSHAAITKEHVLPRWAFEKKPDKRFVTNINGLIHYYDRTTIPACSTCNSVILNDLEKHINELFCTHNLPHDYFTDEELENIIRWLEIVDYKFQVFNLITKFHVSKKSGPIPYLSDFPLSVLDPNFNYSPAKVISILRQSLQRIAIKSKQKNISSLVIFKSSNPSQNLFHKNNDYIFLELPNKKIALLYFFQKLFLNIEEARDAALQLIETHY